jgi:hypothetical protein
MDKGKSDRGVRMKESGVDEDIPVADATQGDEGIDDRLDGKPFVPGKPEKYAAEQSHDVDPVSRGTNLAQDGPDRTSTAPGAFESGTENAVMTQESTEGNRVTSVDPTLVDEEVLPSEPRPNGQEDRRGTQVDKRIPEGRRAAGVDVQQDQARQSD